MLIICASFYMNFSHIETVNSWNVHTYQVIDENGALVESLVNMETGLRGYALNGKEEMLELITTDRKPLRPIWRKLKR